MSKCHVLPLCLLHLCLQAGAFTTNGRIRAPVCIYQVGAALYDLSASLWVLLMSPCMFRNVVLKLACAWI
jgi:hypothetical protein